MMKFAQNYTDVLTRKPKNFRDIARDIALDSLYLLENLKGYEHNLNKPRVQMLYFHHIFNDEEKKFDGLLKKLSKNHTFISYSEAVNRILTNTIDKPYIAFSSDDGLKNNLKAAEILNEYDASCCFFINTDLIEESNFETLKHYCNTRIDFPPAEMLTWKEVAILQNQGHEIGSHTLNHINIAQTAAAQIQEDMHKTFEILKNKCGNVKHFAYPYGRFFHFSEIGRQAVFEAGFQSCATAERGCHINGQTPIEKNNLAIRRDQLIAHWKWEHIYYFLINNSKKAGLLDPYFPYSVQS
ncbi:polysaccharide deacetylase family protein [Flavobacterium branchiophilum]|uniref:Probable polysaccharide deacetylase n=1 Tax=Flavobacterium branchiophilum (strain FL-15) TaxID=1034807 RepID=G2Z6N7_FLABF|nr:polysaccharide deacetylase family protein [Flavobacterium branchiophilum]CCB68879.1 Probable polysaccharide deacetylase [Flavobacterium branchiophilum FL-15]